MTKGSEQLYVCPRAKECKSKKCPNKHYLPHSRTIDCDTEWCAYEKVGGLKCIPVEPEKKFKTKGFQETLTHVRDKPSSNPPTERIRKEPEKKEEKCEYFIKKDVMEDEVFDTCKISSALVCNTGGNKKSCMYYVKGTGKAVGIEKSIRNCKTFKERKCKWATCNPDKAKICPDYEAVGQGVEVTKKELEYLASFQCQHKPKCDDYSEKHKTTWDMIRGACCNSCWVNRWAKQKLSELKQSKWVIKEEKIK